MAYRRKQIENSPVSWRYRRIRFGLLLCLLALISAAPAFSQGLVGEWGGGKSENNPFQGGYYNLNWTFTFDQSGHYKEVVTMGSARVFVATGTYSVSRTRKAGDPTVQGILAFNPEQSQYTNPEFAKIVAFFPIPTDTEARFYIGMSPLGTGRQITLENASGGASSESWGLKSK